jgi:hypothetical protein
MASHDIPSSTSSIKAHNAEYEALIEQIARAKCNYRRALGEARPISDKEWVRMKSAPMNTVGTYNEYTRLVDEAKIALTILQPRLDAAEEMREAFAWLEDESFDLRCLDIPTCRDDYDIEWVVISHHMDAPKEREEGRGQTPLEASRSAKEKKRQL